MSQIGLTLAAGTLGRWAFFRSALLRVASAGGRLRKALQSGLPRVAVLYFYAIVLVAIYTSLAAPDFDRRWRYFFNHPTSILRPPLLTGSLRWFFAGALGPWVLAMAVAALLTALAAVMRARRRIVVVSFLNLTGDTALNSLADSLPRRLSNQLSDIADVFTHVGNDPADLSIEHGSPALAVAVDPSAGVFAGVKASIKDQSVKVGFVNVPLDWAVTTLSTLVQGPQITGSVQKTASGLLLEASLSGGGMNFSWRIGESDVNADRESKEQDAPIIDRMISQLACRIFTNLNHDEMGTREWRAAQHYIEGLRAFRAWRRQGDSTPALFALQRAQKEFFAACPEDPAFLRTRYNLGVIYSYQKEPVAAYAIFEEAINMTVGAAPAGLPGTASYNCDRKDLASAHYAAATAARDMALAIGDQKRREQQIVRVQYHCAFALQLSPWHAAAWQLQSQCDRIPRLARHIKWTVSRKRLAAARRAGAISWWNLCAAAWKGTVRSIEISRAAGDTADLALCLSGKRSSTAAMKQALRLHPELSKLWFELGKLHLARKNLKSAQTAFEKANRESERAVYWTAIAYARRQRGESGAVDDAWIRARTMMEENPWQVRGVRLFWVESLRPGFEWQARRRFHDWRSETRRIRRLEKLLDAAGGTVYNGGLEGPVAEFVPAKHRGSPRDMADWLSRNHDSKSVARRLSPVFVHTHLGSLIGLSPEDQRGIEIGKDLVLRNLGRNPMGGLERYNLANIYLLMGLHDRANAESLNARMLSTNQELRMQSIAIALATFRTVTDIDIRRKAVRHAFNSLRDLAENATGNIWQLDLGRVPWVFFNLGMMSFELLEFPTAQRAFETCVAFRYYVPLSLQWLAQVNFRCGAFEEAERAYLRLKEFFPGRPNASEPPVPPGYRPPGGKPPTDGGHDPNDRQPPAAAAVALEAQPQTAAVAEAKAAEEQAAREKYVSLVDRQLQLAFAANHTAAAFAEQGLVEAALNRWSEGTTYTRGWLELVPRRLPDGRTVNEFHAVDSRADVKGARSLSRGAILLAAGVDRTDPSKLKQQPPFEVPAAPGEQLKQAIHAFRDTIASALEVSIRADAFYRTAVACVELSSLETDNTATWRRRAEDAANRAEASDRRGEYVDRIASLRKNLKPST